VLRGPGTTEDEPCVIEGRGHIWSNILCDGNGKDMFTYASRKDEMCKQEGDLFFFNPSWAINKMSVSFINRTQTRQGAHLDTVRHYDITHHN